MPDCATTLLALKEVGLPNLGVTLDFAHVLYADEQPAFVASLIARHSRVLGVHLNDGYGKRDDGLMVGVANPIQTIELLRQIRNDGFVGPIYFDTFPDLTGLDPVKECEANISRAGSITFDILPVGHGLLHSGRRPGRRIPETLLSTKYVFCKKSACCVSLDSAESGSSAPMAKMHSLAVTTPFGEPRRSRRDRSFLDCARA
jgi:hypothetical protein